MTIFCHCCQYQRMTNKLGMYFVNINKQIYEHVKRIKIDLHYQVQHFVSEVHLNKQSLYKLPKVLKNWSKHNG